MCSYYHNPDINPDIASGLGTVRPESIESGHEFGHRVRILLNADYQKDLERLGV